MKVQEMRRGQLEAVARRLGIKHPDRYLLPDLRAAVKARHHKRKAAKHG